MSHEPKPSVERPIESTSSARVLESDAWLEDLLLAGVHAAVKPSLSTDPISAPPTTEPSLPSWLNVEEPSLEMESETEKFAEITKIDLDEANDSDAPSEQISAETNIDVEMNHLLSNENVDTKPAEDLDQLVDSIFHGLNAQLASTSIEAEELTSATNNRGAIEEEFSEPVTAIASEETASEIAEPDLDSVTAEFAEAIKLVEAEIPEEAIPSDELASTSFLDEEEPTPVSAVDDEPAAKNSEASDAMTQEAIHSLLAKFDDSDVPMIPSAPKEPGVKASCPAGSPQPKINLAALKKVKPGGEEPPALAARLFGGDTLEGGGNDDASDRLSGEINSSLTPLIMGEKQLPGFLLALDGVTDRVRNVHSFLPIALGGLGAFLFVNGVLTIVLASLGWI